MNSTNVSPDSHPDTAILLWTIEFGSKNQILRLLEEKKADLSATNKNGDTVLHLLFRNKSFSEMDVVNLLKIFLDRGLLDPNTENKRGERILLVAVANRMKSVVEVLISYGADVDDSDQEGNSVAHLFVQDEKNKFLELLELNERGCEEMEVESASLVELLIEKGVDFGRKNMEGKSALELSIEYNLHHISLVLLKHTRDVNFLMHLFLRKLNDKHFKALDWYSDYTFRYAARIVKLMLEKGASAVDPDNSGESPLRKAIKGQKTSIVETMIDHHLKSCDDSSATFFELLKSCAWWDESKIEYFYRVLGNLMAKGADVNAKDECSMTPLHYAFQTGNRRAVEFLDYHDADFAATSEKNENLFHTLAKKDPRVKFDDRTLELLFELLVVKSSCDLNDKNEDEETPLHLAAKTGNLAMARKLIEHAAEVDCKNKYRETPLHLAVQRNQSEKLVEVLLENGADVNSKDHRGRRPLLRAVDSERDDNPVVPLLLKWGAYVNVRDGNPSAFFTAIKLNCWCNARVILANGASLNDKRVVGLLRKSESREQQAKTRFVLWHYIKLAVAKLPRPTVYRSFVKDHLLGSEREWVHNDCLSEIEKMKATFINDGISIYAFLHMHNFSRQVYLNNENLKKVIQYRSVQQHFPQYKGVILNSYRDAVLWKSLLEPAKQAFYQLMMNIPLPYECCEMIVIYLGNQELVNIIELAEEA